VNWTLIALSGWCVAYAAVVRVSGPRAERRLGERDRLGWSALSLRNRAQFWRLRYFAGLGLAVLLAILSFIV
jgi:hypothetical protein